MVPLTQGPQPDLSAIVLTRSTGEAKTYFVRLTYTGAKPPQPLIDALEARGFFANGRSGRRERQPDVLVIEEMGRPGNGLFGAWTVADSVAALDELKAVFDEHGLPFAPALDASGMVG